MRNNPTLEIMDKKFEGAHSLNKRSRIAENPIQSMASEINSDDFILVLGNVTWFRMYLSKDCNPPIQEVIECGVVPRFVQLLSGQVNAPPDVQDKIVLQAAWALTNIAAGEHNHALCVVESGSIPIFVNLLEHPNADIREQSIWALGNIAGDSPQLRDSVLEHNVMGRLLAIVQKEIESPSASLSIMRDSTWTLSNLCRGMPAPDWKYISPAVPILRRLLYFTDTKTLSDAAWAVSYISDGPSMYVSEIIKAGFVGLLVALLADKNDFVQRPCLHALGNIVTGSDEHTQVVVESGALVQFRHLLRSPHKSIQKECCWVISNIAAGTHAQVQAVIEANLIPAVISLLHSDDQKTRNEAAWAICNATCHNDRVPQQVKYLVAQGCLKPLCDILSSQDSTIVQVILDGIDNILSVGQAEARKGSPKNEYLIMLEDIGAVHKSEYVCHKSKSIIEKYLGES